ncbi:MAG: type II toxin-antitoxin system RelE/ParE family toxin [Spirochaetes bacterium]|nr:MAG: type II toxin-antitoxin system RelE/ParE family toxin [Spirochaetota bacterium]
MKRSIIFYRMDDGKCPVEDFIDSLSDKIAQKVIAVFKLIEDADLVSSKFFKKLSGSDLWECRITWKSDIFRFLGFFDKNNIVILTNGFQKKTQKTPLSEIDRAVKYMYEYKRRNKK